MKIIALTIAYYLGHKTGIYVVPPITKFIKDKQILETGSAYLKKLFSDNKSTKNYF